MCKLLIGLKLNNGQNDDFSRIIQAQEDDIKTQKDGVASFIIKENGQVITHKELKDYDKVLKPTYNALFESKLIGIHSRIATSGLVDKANIHFFEDGDYVFAHNGYVWAYSTYGEGTRINWGEQSRAIHNTYHGDYSKPIKEYGQQKAIIPNTAIKQTLTDDEIDEVGDLLDELRDIRELIISCMACESIDNPCTEHFNEAMAAYNLAKSEAQSRAG